MLDGIGVAALSSIYQTLSVSTETEDLPASYRMSTAFRIIDHLQKAGIGLHFVDQGEQPK